MAVLTDKIKIFFKYRLTVGVAISVFILVGFLSFLFFQSLQVRQNSKDINLIKTQLGEIIKLQVSMDTKHEQDIRDLRLTIYNLPDSTTVRETVRQPSFIEKWQVNRDRELRDRISQIQKDLMNLNSRVYRLER